MFAELALEPAVLLILCAVAFTAGFIDAIAGGGGLLTVPALLTAGLPPHVVLGTNKLAATFGSFTASLTYYRKKLFNPIYWRRSLLYTAIGAVLGTLVVDMLSKEALEKIISTARHHNPRFGITGLLVFGSGIFFQWLEGPKDNVTSLYKKISADSRHSDVVLLTKEDEFRERLFPNWDMELVAAEDISAVLEDAMHEASDPKQKSTLFNMLHELNKGPLGK